KDNLSLAVPNESLEGALTEPLLFILLQNPIRENAKETFEYFKKQGVNIKVISGDSPVTVSEVAKNAGIAGAEKYVDASKLDDTEIPGAVKDNAVFGRVSPEQKQKIVRALKKSGHTVAMTGDGVNDILAMKDADCSIAMAAGSEAAIQASQVVLLDSDFSRMPKIVAEGRRNINNIERTATLFLVKNIFSFLLAVFSIINVWVYPLQPSQITMVSLFNIGIPGFFLAMEPNNKRIEGHFLVKVLLKAMPAALTDFFAIAALVVFSNTFGVNGEDVSVASTFLLAIVGFIILANISLTINLYRIKVIAGCIMGMIVATLFFNNLFSISYVSLECVMLFVLFAIATEPFMRYLTMLFTYIEKRYNHK
ncbi:MAG: HAD-IC family P-type ATPase, partial [Butyrivibrio sp.]|nr:HAD-IC family P-type ATPase [Butyrivibrio sp.]